MRVLDKFAATLCFFSLSATGWPNALAQQAGPTQQTTVPQDAAAQVPPRALEPATGKPAEAVPAKPANGWRAVSTRQPGEALKIKLTNGSVIKGKFKSASDDGVALELKNQEVSLTRGEIASVAVVSKRSAGKATLTGTAVGGGLGAGAGAGIGALIGAPGSFLGPRRKAAAVGAGVGVGMGAVLGSLIGLAVGLSGHRETVIYQDLPAK